MLSILLLLLFSNTSGYDNGGTSMLQSLGEEFNLKRPVIHTFIFTEGGNIALDDASINTWAEAWADNGWEPVVMTEIEASRHPEYAKYVDKLSAWGVLPSRLRTFLRYLAMSSQRGDGGWYSDPNVYPVQHADAFHGRGFHFPNLGNFTIHDGVTVPNLMSGNKQEWNRIASYIIKDVRRNDALILKVLNDKNPGFYNEEYSIIKMKDILDKKNTALCGQLEKKIATKVNVGVRALGFTNHHTYYNALKTSLEECKPIMHTFFEHAYNGDSDLNLHLTLVGEWKKSWKEAGWNPIVLTLNDAKKHILFDEFQQAFEKATFKTSLYDQMCFYRWLAMASLDNGGWMSDYDTFPLQIRHTLTRLPNNGRFTSNQRHVPSLISGSQPEWNRMVKLLFASYQSHTNTFWSDMRALEDIHKHQMAYIQTNDAIDLYNVYSNPPSHMKVSHTYNDGAWVDLDAAYNKPFELKKFCLSTKSKLVIHFSHDACHKVGFCHRTRGSNLTKWLNAWLSQCYYTYT